MALNGPTCILSIFDERVFHPPGTLGADRKSDHEHSTIFIQSKTDSARGLRVDQRMLLHNIMLHNIMLHNMRSMRNFVWHLMRFGML
jgi:hypothetical protein